MRTCSRRTVHGRARSHSHGLPSGSISTFVSEIRITEFLLLGGLTLYQSKTSRDLCHDCVEEERRICDTERVMYSLITLQMLNTACCCRSDEMSTIVLFRWNFIDTQTHIFRMRSTRTTSRHFFEIEYSVFIDAVGERNRR